MAGDGVFNTAQRSGLSARAPLGGDAGDDGDPQQHPNYNTTNTNTNTKHSRVALGFVTALDYANPYLSPYQVGRVV